MGGRKPRIPRRSSNSLMEPHEGKEVVCPTCHSHFLGFTALQAHVEKAHFGNGPPSGQMTGINRLGLDYSKNNRLVCPECQQILPHNLMETHLLAEHGRDGTNGCQILADPDQEPACGERLKNQLSTALDVLLDKAVNNLLTNPDILPDNHLSGGAAEILSKLCAMKMKDASFRKKFNSKLTKTKIGETDETLRNKPFQCENCGLRFTVLVLKERHVQNCRSKQSKSTNEDTFSDIDDYENDWRGVPSPSDSTNDGNGDTDSFNPTCSECGLSFPTLNDVLRHRVEYHSNLNRNRRVSYDHSNSSRPNTPNSMATVSSYRSGSTTPLPTMSASSTASTSSTALSLVNALMRFHPRTRSSSVETQSSSGGYSSVSSTSNLSYSKIGGLSDTPSLNNIPAGKKNSNCEPTDDNEINSSDTITNKFNVIDNVKDYTSQSTDNINHKELNNSKRSSEDRIASSRRDGSTARFGQTKKYNKNKLGTRGRCVSASSRPIALTKINKK